MDNVIKSVDVELEYGRITTIANTKEIILWPISNEENKMSLTVNDCAIIIKAYNKIFNKKDKK